MQIIVVDRTLIIPVSEIKYITAQYHHYIGDGVEAYRMIAVMKNERENQLLAEFPVQREIETNAVQMVDVEDNPLLTLAELLDDGKSMEVYKVNNDVIVEEL